MSVVDQAYAHVNANQPGAASALLERAGEAGDSAAWLELAVWFLSGQVVTRDLARSRDCFRRAGEGGHDQAAMIHLSFLAIGVGGDRDWPGAVHLLQKRARTDAEAARQVTLLEGMSLDEEGNPLSLPPTVELSRSPYVATVEKLFTREECDYLIALASPLMQGSVIVDPLNGQMRPDPIRSSDAAMLAWIEENPVVHALNRRIAAVSGSLVEAGEPLQVLRYRPGQEYRPHHDALPGATNQRVSTLLVYLNEDFTGGETSFAAAGLTYKGGVGDALLFRNAHPDGRIDQAALHAGLPVTTGCKFLASRWIHERQFAPLR
jgi:prolyl 4-hydroxylase